MTGPSRQMGSGSNSRSHLREDDDVTDETPQQRTPQATTTPGPDDHRIYLSARPGGVWWDDKKIVELLGRSFTDTYDEYVTSWTSATPSQQDKMYNYFRTRVTIDPGYDLRREYENRIKTRITVPINRAAKDEKRPNWMPDKCFQLLLRRKDDPKWKAKAEKAKANRLSGGSDGKALATSTLGQQSAARAFAALGMKGTPHQLLTKSKKNKKGEWISPRAEQIDAEYQRLKAEHDPSGQMSEAEFRLYLEAAGGFNNKTRVFGLGRAARELFVPPRASTLHSRSSGESSYTPSIISQYASKNAELADRVAQLQTQAEEDRRRAEEDRRRTRALEERMAQQFGWTYDVQETCTPGPTHGPRDDFADDGHGFGSQPVHPLG